MDGIAQRFQRWHSTLSEAPIEVAAIGLELRVRLPMNASRHLMTVIETVNAPGFGPPLHRHPQTEAFRVLEGQYLYEMDGDRFIVEEGEVVSVPGGAALRSCASIISCTIRQPQRSRSGPNGTS